MKIERQVSLNTSPFAGWAIGPTGLPILLLEGDGEKLRVELTPEEAREIGCGAIFAAMTVATARAAAQQARQGVSSLVGADGKPVM